MKKQARIDIRIFSIIFEEGRDLILPLLQMTEGTQSTEKERKDKNQRDTATL